MDFTGFYHENKSRYAYAYDMQTLHIRLRTGLDAVEKINMAVFDHCEWHKNAAGVHELKDVQLVPMAIEQTSRYHDWWFAEAPAPTKRVKYIFIVEKGGERYLYGPGGELPYGKNDGELTPFISKHSMLCYIFPYILAEDLFHAPKWAKETVWYQIFPSRYGEDLPGIIAQLDDIKSLGCTGIYMTPIFTSPSVHKYNTEDYFRIDPGFGDLTDFFKLVDEAHKRGIRIMLDLVFNHIGSTHPLWLDVVAKGKKSRYYDWFYVREDGSYETFATVKNMPKWNTENPEARNYLIDTALYWAHTIDGYRLDVANECSHEFWRVFRKKVREVNPEIYIVGEVWHDSMSYLLGDQFDTVMNYPLATAIWKFVSGETGGTELREDMANCLVMYPRDRHEVMFNHIGNHDTKRILSLCKNRPERVKQAFTLLLTAAGSPMIFYGDEVGITGEDHDDARKPMIWDEAERDNNLRDFVAKLISLRSVYPEMREVDITWIKAGDEGVIYTKGDLIVMLNPLDKPAKLPLPAGWAGRKAQDLLDDSVFTIGDTADMAPFGTLLWRLV
ncbi:MAG: glycoside hydrolase family 13 protein [Defluviitaleaceae bacterium]|nr:glycoside hydrolase family 13 protein [Defluviitaleaceae bacterium]